MDGRCDGCDGCDIRAPRDASSGSRLGFLSWYVRHIRLDCRATMLPLSYRLHSTH
jgi:hypothetical protein